MKQLTCFASILLCLHLAAQQPYSPYHKKNLLFLYDTLPIAQGSENTFFSYALELFKKDSLVKAGQMLDRLYWYDTTTALSRQALFMRTKTEQLLEHKFMNELYGSFNRVSCSTVYGPAQPPCEKGEKRVMFSKEKVSFFLNGKLVRETGYLINFRFEWFSGDMSNLIIYDDDKAQWMLILYTIADAYSLKKLTLSHYEFKDKVKLTLVDDGMTERYYVLPTSL